MFDEKNEKFEFLNYLKTSEGMTQFFEDLMPEIKDLWLKAIKEQGTTDLVLFIPSTQDSINFIPRSHVQEIINANPNILDDLFYQRIQVPASNKGLAFWTLVVFPDGSLFSHRIHMNIITKGGEA
jgi:hypothetical protein